MRWSWCWGKFICVLGVWVDGPWPRCGHHCAGKARGNGWRNEDRLFFTGLPDGVGDSDSSCPGVASAGKPVSVSANASPRTKSATIRSFCATRCSVVSFATTDVTGHSTSTSQSTSAIMTYSNRSKCHYATTQAATPTHYSTAAPSATPNATISTASHATVHPSGLSTSFATMGCAEYNGPTIAPIAIINSTTTGTGASATN